MVRGSHDSPWPGREHARVPTLRSLRSALDLNDECMYSRGQADAGCSSVPAARAFWFRLERPVPWGCLRPAQATPEDRKSTSELQSLMRISYAVFCLKKNNTSMCISVMHTVH